MGLRESILTESVSRMDIRDVIAVKPSCSMRDAVGLMRRKALGCVVVVDDEGSPVGTFTERILIKTLLEYESKAEDYLDQPVSAHMGNPWDKVKLSDTIATLVDKMQSKGLRFIVVVDDAGRAVGLTGQKGLMSYVAEHFPRQVKVQPMQSNIGINEREGA